MQSACKLAGCLGNKNGLAYCKEPCFFARQTLIFSYYLQNLHTYKRNTYSIMQKCSNDNVSIWENKYTYIKYIFYYLNTVHFRFMTSGTFTATVIDDQSANSFANRICTAWTLPWRTPVYAYAVCVRMCVCVCVKSSCKTRFARQEVYTYIYIYTIYVIYTCICGVWITQGRVCTVYIRRHIQCDDLVYRPRVIGLEFAHELVFCTVEPRLCANVYQDTIAHVIYT